MFAARKLLALPIVAALCLSVVPLASADVVVESVNEDETPGPFFWALDSIGWYWTPGADVELTGIQTKLFSGAGNINNNVTFTTGIYTDRPANGGVLIDSFTWNGTDFVDGPWLGGSFGSPVDLTGGTQVFVGMIGWAAALTGPSGNPSGGAGVNWVDSPVGAPIENLGAGSSWSSVNPGDDFDLQLSPAGLGATDQPVIRFLAVPEPAVATLVLMGAVAVLRPARRRRG